MHVCREWGGRFVVAQVAAARAADRTPATGEASSSVRPVHVTPGIEEAVAALEPGGRLVGRRELTGGVSANVIGLDIATSLGDRRRVVFRQHRADLKQHGRTVTGKEYRVLAALHRRGVAVPEPYLYDDSTTVTAPYLLIEWIDGTTDLAAEDLPAGLEQMARFLVDLHSLDVARAGGARAHADRGSADSSRPVPAADRRRSAGEGEARSRRHGTRRQPSRPPPR